MWRKGRKRGTAGANPYSRAMNDFPSLRITADALVPEGSFAEAQATYLEPDRAFVKQLDALLRQKKIGVVAHYYMDPELQGVLAACDWPHIGVSDSLLMADRGIEMVEAGCESIIVLGVDFMSENARAMLDDAGHHDVPLYRVAEKEIGCSLAESAEAKAYGAYLAKSADAQNPLHIVYINTSLVTKAKAHALDSDDHLHVVERCSDRASSGGSDRRCAHRVWPRHVHGRESGHLV